MQVTNATQTASETYKEPRRKRRQPRIVGSNQGKAK